MNPSIIFFIALLVTVSLPSVLAEDLEVFTNQQIYTTVHPLLVYGNAPPGEPLVVRIFAPNGGIAEFEQIIVGKDGSFNLLLLEWPESSTSFPYGTYTVEAVTQSGTSKKIDVKFAASIELKQVPIERSITTEVFAPEIAAHKQTIPRLCPGYK